MQADVKPSFTAFASFGAGGKEMSDMESKNFLKCMKDSGLLDKVRARGWGKGNVCVGGGVL